MPFNISSEIQTHTLCPHKSGHRLIKTSRQPEAPAQPEITVGCEWWRRASRQHPTPGQAGAAPRSRCAHSTYAGHSNGISEQHLTAQPRAHLTGRQFEARPRFQHKKRVEMHGLAGRVAPQLSVTAPQQSCSAQSLRPALKTLEPHPGLQKTARASLTAWAEHRAAHSLCLVAQHSTQPC